MDFNLGSEQLLFKETARKFATSDIAPFIADMEKNRRTSPAVMEKMRSLKYYGIQYPILYGGTGASFLEYCLVMEEISKIYCSIGGHLAVNNLCAATIYEFGTEAQKKQYLPSLLAGNEIGSFAFTEPDTGTDPAAIKTTAIRTGDEWVINGRKIFITNATLPGYVALFCRDVEMDGKITTILVPKGGFGFSTGKLYEKMGMHGMEVADIILDNVRVPLANTVGEEQGRGLGFKILTQIIALGKLSISAQCVGMAQAALDEAVKYARTRAQRGKPIGNFQTIQWIIGEMAAEVEAARYMLYAAAFAKAQGEDILVTSARTRLFVSQVAHRAVNGAMQVMGAFGYMKEYPLERLFRDVKLTELYEGVNEIQRVISASALLR